MFKFEFIFYNISNVFIALTMYTEDIVFNDFSDSVSDNSMVGGNVENSCNKSVVQGIRYNQSITEAKQFISSEYMSLNESVAILGAMCTCIQSCPNEYIETNTIDDIKKVAMQKILNKQCPFAVRREIYPGVFEFRSVNSLIIHPDLNEYTDDPIKSKEIIKASLEKNK